MSLLRNMSEFFTLLCSVLLLIASVTITDTSSSLETHLQGDPMLPFLHRDAALGLSCVCFTTPFIHSFISSNMALISSGSTQLCAVSRARVRVALPVCVHARVSTSDWYRHAASSGLHITTQQPLIPHRARLILKPLWVFKLSTPPPLTTKSLPPICLRMFLFLTNAFHFLI